MTLFEECMNALGNDASIVDKEESEKILTEFDKNFPLTLWGRIDWNKIKEKKIVLALEEIISELKTKKRNPLNIVYIIGSDPAIPIIKSKLDKILEVFDDVEAMSPNSWFYCPSDKWVVEIYHNGTITIGFINKQL